LKFSYTFLRYCIYVYLNCLAVDEVERLCAEADQLLGKSEASEDLVLALSLCNLAAGKARAAMDAPYSNPQVASFARMKHNTCVMRARSLHKRLEEPLHSANKRMKNYFYF
jgi:hypothetical protein